MEFNESNFQLLLAENKSHETRIAVLEEEVEDLQADLDAFDESESNKALELFADPANWKKNVWSPFQKWVEKDAPDTIAAQALKE